MTKLHPIVAQLDPSVEQEPAITARGCDVVVTAGAGTGKTRALVARYLSLLAEGPVLPVLSAAEGSSSKGLPLRALVAITFSKKAAREMRNRVRDEVRRYLQTTQSEHWQDLYRQLDAARIGTIHSLCAEILRAHPAEAEVDPRFEVLDEGQANVLQAQALEAALAWAAKDQDAARLFPLLGEHGLRMALNTLLRQRLKVQDPPANLLECWQRVLDQRQEPTLSALVSSPPWQDAVATLQYSAAHTPSDLVEIQRQTALAALQEAQRGTLPERLASLARLRGINLRGGSKNAWPGGESELKDVKTALRALRELWQAQAGLLELALTPHDEALAGAIPALHAAFALALARYDALKQERRVLDFDDLESGALALLQARAAVRARWQKELQAILVDEFQDTNSRQRDLLQILNGDGNKLFIVGDGKQSIYRFRNADVTVFRGERRRIQRQGGHVSELQTSYRAHRELLQGLNDLLRPVLGDGDPARPWLEPFAPLEPFRETPCLEPPHVELHLTVGSKDAGALNRAADALAERVVELVESERSLHYGHVAILCRSSTSFGAYENALDRANVPFVTVAGRGFYGRPEIRDLLNTLQALSDPTDDLALAGLLRSPALAFSDEALYGLCQQRDEAPTPQRLWDALQASGAERAVRPGSRRAVSLIAALHRQAGRISVAELLKTWLDATDYCAALIQAGQTRAARNVSKLLADAHASGIVSVGEFLEYVANLRDSGTREGEARATVGDAVQIMSVHAAKGLEFPLVVIGDVGYHRQSRNFTLIDDDLGLLLPLKDEDEQLPAAYRLGKFSADDQDEAELRRLFYVAATRAREKLILSGCFKLNKDNKPASLTGWLAQVAGPLGLLDEEIEYQEEGANVIRKPLQVGQTPVSCAIYEPGWTGKRRAHTAQPQAETPVPLPPPLLEPVLPGVALVDQRASEQGRIPHQRVWRVAPAVERPSAPAWVIGSLVHEALAAWRLPSPPLGEPALSLSKGTEGGRWFERWATARAREYGLTDPRQLAHAVRQSRRLLLRFGEHPLYAEMNSAQRRLHEVPYSRVTGGQVERGIIDAMYLREGVWTIVEFKTDRVRDAHDFEKLLSGEDYVEQAQRYISAVEHLLGQRPRCVLCMLNYAGAVHLRWVGLREHS